MASTSFDYYMVLPGVVAALSLGRMLKGPALSLQQCLKCSIPCVASHMGCYSVCVSDPLVARIGGPSRAQRYRNRLLALLGFLGVADHDSTPLPLCSLPKICRLVAAG